MPSFTLAVCLYDGVTALDFAGPTELLTARSTYNRTTWPQYLEALPDASDLIIDATYIAFTLDPLRSTSGMSIAPDKTYKDVIGKEQFDILLVPGGETHVAFYPSIVCSTVFCRHGVP